MRRGHEVRRSMRRAHRSGREKEAAPMRVRSAPLACRLLGLPAVAGLVPLLPPFAGAQAWPTKPVHIIVSSGAGGTADILARMVGERLGPCLRATHVHE